MEKQRIFQLNNIGIVIIGNCISYMPTSILKYYQCSTPLNFII